MIGCEVYVAPEDHRVKAPVPGLKMPYDHLVLLAENAGRCVTKDEIIEGVWQGRIVSDSAISTRISA